MGLCIYFNNTGGRLTMANNHYLCRCNMCEAIMFDENPNIHSGPTDITKIEKPINHMIQFHDGGEFYWGCPNCSTDSYLMDLTNNDFKK